MDRSRICVPHTVVGIAAHAFDGCHTLSVLLLPATLQSVGKDVFVNCDALSAVYIDDLGAWCGVRFENETANPLSRANNLYVNGALLTELTVPDGVEKVSNYAFYGVKSLKAVILPQSVTKIGQSAFEGYVQLEHFALPTARDFSKIEKRVFYGCAALESIDIPDNITMIEDEAFYGCGGMKSLAVGRRMSYVGNGAFAGCGGLESIEVDCENVLFCSTDNCLIYMIENKLVLGCKNSVIPTDGSVTEIGSYAFMNCVELTHIYLPQSITKIGESAFAGCTNLTNIEYGGTVVEWDVLQKDKDWNAQTAVYTVSCTDGDRPKE